MDSISEDNSTDVTESGLLTVGDLSLVDLAVGLDYAEGVRYGVGYNGSAEPDESLARELLKECIGERKDVVKVVVLLCPGSQRRRNPGSEG